MVRRLPSDRFAEGIEAYLSADPQHCVLTVDDRAPAPDGGAKANPRRGDDPVRADADNTTR